MQLTRREPMFWNVYRISRGGQVQLHRTVGNAVHAQKIASMLTESNYPRYVYYHLPLR